MRYTCGMHVPNVFSMHPMSVSEHGQSFSAWVWWNQGIAVQKQPGWTVHCDTIKEEYIPKLTRSQVQNEATLFPYSLTHPQHAASNGSWEGGGGRLETRLAKYTELGLRLASFLPLPSLWSKGRTWLAWLRMNVVRILQHWVNFLLWLLIVFFTDISWLHHGNKCLQNETCKYSI